MEYPDWAGEAIPRAPYAGSQSPPEAPSRDEDFPDRRWDGDESPWVPRPRSSRGDSDPWPASPGGSGLASRHSRPYHALPAWQEAPYDDPGYDDPRYDGLRGDDPRYDGLRGDDPGYNGLRGDDPGYNGLRGDDPRYNGLRGEDQPSGDRHWLTAAAVPQDLPADATGHPATRRGPDRRPDSSTPGQRSRQTGGGEVEPKEGRYASAMVASAGWFAVPLVPYLVWVFTLSSTPEAGCVDASGAPCPADRAAAITGLVNALPRVATALLISFAAASLLRLASMGRRTVAIGFAGAVVGAGGATVLFSLLARTPLG